MADLSITAGSVVKGTGAVTVQGLAGETITAGMAVYLDSSANLYKKASTSTATTAAVVGIALNGASLNQPIVVQTAGQITIGATVAAGVWYEVSDTGGGIRATSDAGHNTGDFCTLIGGGISATTILLGIVQQGVAAA